MEAWLPLACDSVSPLLRLPTFGGLDKMFLLSLKPLTVGSQLVALSGQVTEVWLVGGSMSLDSKAPCHSQDKPPPPPALCFVVQDVSHQFPALATIPSHVTTLTSDPLEL